MTDETRKQAAKTLQERFGFKDHDLTTPVHDEMILWLDSNIASVIEELNGPIGWISPELDKIRSDVKAAYEGSLKHWQGELAANESQLEYYGRHEPDSWEGKRIPGLKATIEEAQGYIRGISGRLKDPDLGLGKIPECPGRKVLERLWEMPISNRGYTIGFVDMKVSYEAPSIEGRGYVDRPSYSEKHHYELANEHKAAPQWAVEWQKAAYCFEVKSTIPSMGELIRQIRLYQQYEQTPFVVVAPDTRFRSALEGQGIRFVQYVK